MPKAKRATRLERFSIQLSSQDAARIRQIAEAEHRTRSCLVRILVSRGLESWVLSRERREARSRQVAA